MLKFINKQLENYLRISNNTALFLIKKPFLKITSNIYIIVIKINNIQLT